MSTKHEIERTVKGVAIKGRPLFFEVWEDLETGDIVAAWLLPYRVQIATLKALTQ